MDNNQNKPDWVLISLTVVIIALMTAMVCDEYLSYLTTKRKCELVETAISNKWPAEQIQGLINSKK